MVMQELPQPRETHVLIRGSHNVKGERGLARRARGCCTRSRPGQPANRLGLARWLVDPRNPLVGRRAS